MILLTNGANVLGATGLCNSVPRTFQRIVFPSSSGPSGPRRAKVYSNMKAPWSIESGEIPLQIQSDISQKTCIAVSESILV